MSREVELELNLQKINSNIILYSKLIRRIPKGQKIFGKKLSKLITKQQECFRELRSIVRKKHPELFIGSGYNGN